MRGINGHILPAIYAIVCMAPLALSNCAGSDQAKLILSEAAACETVGNGLKAIAPLVDKLDAKGRAALDAARATARPFCSDPKNPPKDIAAAVPALIQASGQIQGLAAAIGGK